MTDFSILSITDEHERADVHLVTLSASLSPAVGELKALAHTIKDGLSMVGVSRHADGMGWARADTSDTILITRLLNLPAIGVIEIYLDRGFNRD